VILAKMISHDSWEQPCDLRDASVRSTVLDGIELIHKRCNQRENVKPRFEAVRALLCCVSATHTISLGLVRRRSLTGFSCPEQSS
jgi:hypothetical protein